MKVAIVGSGVSGLAATWLLNEHSDHEIHLFEADARPGGHANTVTFEPDGKEPAEVDTGFIVFNPSTYPNFLRFLRHYPSLASRILPTEMTFSVSRDLGAFEWAGNNFRAVFCQLHRILDPAMWRLVYDVLRFNAAAQKYLLDLDSRPGQKTEEISIGEYLRRERYSDSFRDNYLIPMTAAIWSTPPDKCALDFPAQTLIQFMQNHHLLQIVGKPAWLTLQGGSRTYVQHILSRVPASNIHLSTPVRSLKSLPIMSDSGKQGYRVELTTDVQPSSSHANATKLETTLFDHVILATHADTTMRILTAHNSSGITAEEERVLGAFKFSQNEAVLHSDRKLMPVSRLAWSCWNYLTRSGVDTHGKPVPNVNQVSLTYWMNALQHLSHRAHGMVFVTLNPPFEPDPAHTYGRYQYDHPIFDAAAIRAQRALPGIQRTRGVSYAGAWTRYGFHEDGFTSGLRAAAVLIDTKLPFEITEAHRPPDAIALWAARAFEHSALFSVVAGLLCWILGRTMMRIVLGVPIDSSSSR